MRSSGQLLDSSNNTYVAPSTEALFRAQAFGESGMQRLTKEQLMKSLENNLGQPMESLRDEFPEDSSSSTFFHNDYSLLSINLSVVDAYSKLSVKIAKLYPESQFLTDIKCQPQHSSDRVCFVKFLEIMGRRFLRRPLTADEIDKWSDLMLSFALEDNRFMTAVEYAIETLSQHPEFLYRVEKGKSSDVLPNYLELNSYEIVSRMSFLIKGQGPSDEDFEVARLNQVETPAQRVALFEKMMQTEAANENWQSFHSQWLGYGEIILDPQYSDDFMQESNKLVSRVISERMPWLTLFSMDESYLTPQLAELYQMPAIDRPQWVKLSGEKSSGILSHGAFAAVGAKFGDTSPTLRGYEVYKRLYCGHFDVDIPANVDTNERPGSSTSCKTDNYFMRSNTACVQCHGITDGIGFGLEVVDQFGRIRDREPVNTYCSIDGRGDVMGENFTGVSGLSQIVTQDHRVAACATQRIFEFMMGRNSSAEDNETLKALEGQYFVTKDLHGILRAIVSSEAIRFKKEKL